MSRWMPPETRDKINALIAQGFTRRRICARLNITLGQYERQVRISGLHAKRDSWGVAKTYKELQGGKRG